MNHVKGEIISRLFGYSFPPGVDYSGGPLLDDDLGVMRLRRVILVHRGKVIRHSDGPRQSGVLLVCADHRHDGYRHAQITACGERWRALGCGESACLDLCSRTCCVLLTDESHDLHEAVADALFIRVLVNGDAGPVRFLIVTLLVHHLTALNTTTHQRQSHMMMQWRNCTCI